MPGAAREIPEEERGSRFAWPNPGVEWSYRCTPQLLSPEQAGAEQQHRPAHQQHRQLVAARPRSAPLAGRFSAAASSRGQRSNNYYCSPASDSSYERPWQLVAESPESVGVQVFSPEQLRLQQARPQRSRPASAAATRVDVLNNIPPSLLALELTETAQGPAALAQRFEDAADQCRRRATGPVTIAMRKALLKQCPRTAARAAELLRQPQDVDDRTPWRKLARRLATQQQREQLPLPAQELQSPQLQPPDEQQGISVRAAAPTVRPSSAPSTPLSQRRPPGVAPLRVSPPSHGQQQQSQLQPRRRAGDAGDVSIEAEAASEVLPEIEVGHGAPQPPQRSSNSATSNPVEGNLRLAGSRRSSEGWKVVVQEDGTEQFTAPAPEPEQPSVIEFLDSDAFPSALATAPSGPIEEERASPQSQAAEDCGAHAAKGTPSTSAPKSPRRTGSSPPKGEVSNLRTSPPRMGARLSIVSTASSTCTSFATPRAHTSDAASDGSRSVPTGMRMRAIASKSARDTSKLEQYKAKRIEKEAKINNRIVATQKAMDTLRANADSCDHQQGAADENSDIPTEVLLAAHEAKLPLQDVRAMFFAFKAADVAEEGGLDFDSFVDVTTQVLKGRFDNVDPENVINGCKRIWDSTNKNPMSRIDFNEFFSWYAAHCFREDWSLTMEQRRFRDLAQELGVSIELMERVKWDFDKQDSDGSGQIDISEFKGILYKILRVPHGVELPFARVRHFWKEVDTDDSG
eukprot:CAMPEP_0178408122 /NCGR_PEP_ID=MMETSP0689_2-20121128/19777_1 /TAXON_ID=160604 /ORGANISM="Amphidinium massartii, Strain CS-259" /LENGTH=743 /DNA_ID=CAMNT_0020029209 /DNA_START=79 /DNA_END=2308 /DNA_ORIENTATION=-